MSCAVLVSGLRIFIIHLFCVFFLYNSQTMQVTYMCHTGRFEVFNENFPAGILPNDKLLPKYNLHEYMNVVQAPRKGDLRLRQHSSSRTRRSVLEVRCLGKAGAPSLPGTHEENLSDPARGHQLKLEVIAS
ncbi:enhanced ethylene response protein 5-like isoform X1 [Brassica napus]|uniref:enhanced ethylene response protein 5-like isoform X1 n=1 Tax=Brassica napus TaxID=3708 RepID=UPI0006AB4D1C|nr:enhanced ethylene response protein 5-like isoform X1 [Brassica napus]